MRGRERHERLKGAGRGEEKQREARGRALQMQKASKGSKQRGWQGIKVWADGCKYVRAASKKGGGRGQALAFAALAVAVAVLGLQGGFGRSEVRAG